MFKSFRVNNNRLIKILVYLIILSITSSIIYLYQPILTNINKNIAKQTVLSPQKNKSILYWNTFYGKTHMGFAIGSKMFEKCKYKHCYTTFDKEVMSPQYFDAVIFHGSTYRISEDGIPFIRHPNQKYIFFSRESALNIYYEKDLNEHFYNWTMTVRRDSDIPTPYAIIRNIKTNYKPPTIESIQSRSKKVAWFVSNCWTKGTKRRRKYVRELQKHIPVDIYGQCGNLTCIKRNFCYAMLEENYKFYLSFENSMCEDYVTEKLYNILRLNVVPVVLSFSDYKSLAPPNSVINVNDFINPKQLAEYLHRLDKNVTEYLKYFEWKTDYVVEDSRQTIVCKLCERLHEPLVYSSYENLEDWYKGFGCVA